MFSAQLQRNNTWKTSATTELHLQWITLSTHTHT
jgi:hypothetical protein